MNENSEIIKGTIIWLAPFYNRSGFGNDSRSSVIALTKLGVNIRIIPVNNVEDGIDDTDLPLLKSLEKTKIIPPVTYIVSHVPSKGWLNINLPEPNIKILATTIVADTKTPPQKMLNICREFDQVWISSEQERQLFLENNFEAEHVQFVQWAHTWIENSIIPPTKPEPLIANKPFRFMSISLFSPRRRWDKLIEAFLEEFNDDPDIELYLKVTYPNWHPIEGRPKKDLSSLVENLKKKTSSKAQIIIDDNLGTRTDLINLIDSCNAYVSTDTSLTAPVAEAGIRNRIVILPDSFEIYDETDHIGINCAKEENILLTEEMLLYLPEHKGEKLSSINKDEIRKSLRKAFNLTVEERKQMADKFSLRLPSKKETILNIIHCINEGWGYKKSQLDIAEPYRKNILWEGKIDSKSSLAKVNYEMLVQVDLETSNINILTDDEESKFSEFIVNYVEYIRINPKVGIHIRHEFPPNLTPPKSGRWVIIQPWEFGSLPKSWVEVFSKDVDEMWVPSNYVKEVYIESGVPEERVFVVPNGFNPEVCNKEGAEIKLKTKKKFKFLFVGGTIYRKGIDLLLKAYTELFSKDDDVCLVIKDMGGNSFYDGQTFSKEINEIIEDENAPEIEYIDKFLSDEELKGLYQSADVLVHPYRGEGFGLPILESMACGTPVIITNGGAALDFCNSENSFLVDAEKTFYKEKRVGELETVSHPWLYEVSIEDLKSKMKYVFDNKIEIVDKGNLAFQYVNSNFIWSKSAEKINERIELLSMKPIVRVEREKEQSSMLFSKYIDDAFSFIENKKHNDALSSLSLAIDNFVKNNDNQITLNELLIVKGNLYLATNNLEKAKTTFESALNENPNSSQACQGLGEIFVEVEEYEAGKTMFEWAINNDNTNEIALEKLVKVNQLLGLEPNDFSISEEE